MKRYILVIFLSFIALTVFAQSEELDFYTNLYDNATTVTDQLGIARTVVDAEIDDSASFYAHALKRILVEYPNVTNQREKNSTEDLVRLLAGALGAAEYTDAGQDLWKAVQVFSNPLVKADCIMALGKVGATDLLPQVVQTLKDMNTSKPQDRQTQIGNERIAYAAIVALEQYQDPSGYLPVFFAANAWYKLRVRNQAAESYPKILEDPAEPLTAVIQDPEYPYDMKYLALRTIDGSEIEDASKAAVAVSALAEGWRGSTNDSLLHMELVKIRKLAIDMIRRYGTEDEAVYPLLERSYREGVDEEEQLGVVAALSKISTEDAAKILASFLNNINTRLQRGTLTKRDERLVRAIIPALGATQQEVGQPALRSVLSFDWTNQVITLANQTLKGGEGE
ncbi:MAG: hypothetical protein LBU17_09140 [Treponema sp.]|jgi:HEAT repeat protein|nr:hypothetical protein [Treponema sp.]